MYRHVLCLVLGLIVGMQLTQFWDYMTFTTEQYESTALAGDTTLSSSSSSSSLAEQLYRKTRVLCLVLTMPANHATKAQMVKQTWGSRCNKLVFMSSQDDAQLGAVNLNVTETRANLYNKVRAGLAYAYEHYGEDYDWFLKADDDTYVIMENLRHFLHPYDPEAPVYFGYRFRATYPHGYMSGGAGYVLSRDALRRLNLVAFNSSKLCPVSFRPEDRQIGYCLINVGVVTGDSRDEHGRERFLPLNPRHLIPEIPQNNWLHKTYFFKPHSKDCCSDSGISFHYAKPYDFDMYEYFLYKLRVHARPELPRALPEKLSTEQMQEKLRYWDEQTPDDIEEEN